MSLEEVYHAQQARPCACVRLASRDCIRARSPRLVMTWEPDYDPIDDDERCECSCHDGEYADEDEP